MKIDYLLFLTIFKLKIISITIEERAKQYKDDAAELAYQKGAIEQQIIDREVFKKYLYEHLAIDQEIECNEEGEPLANSWLDYMDKKDEVFKPMAEQLDHLFKHVETNGIEIIPSKEQITKVLKLWKWMYHNTNFANFTEQTAELMLEHWNEYSSLMEYSTKLSNCKY